MPIKIKNRVTINTNIWDIAGQKGFDFLRQRFLIDTSAAICVFDLTILESLNNISNWIKELLEANNQIIMPIVLVGNKSDLTEKRAVSDKDIDNMKNYLIKNEFVSKDGIEYIEASAKTGFNIAEGFNILANEIYNNLKDQN